MRNNRKLSIIAYICVIALLIVLAVFLFKRSSAPEEAEIQGELPQQDWEAKETSVGRIDDIVINQAEATTVSEETEEPYKSEFTETVSSETTETTAFFEDRENAVGDEYALYCSAGRVTSQVEWTNVGIISSSDHEIHYNVGSYDVKVMIAGGTPEDYSQQITDFSESVGGTCDHEYLSYSPSRVTGSYTYDKYLVSYPSETGTIYVYYYLSKISDSEVYIVNITSANEIEDSGTFGVLDYAVE